MRFRTFGTLRKEFHRKRGSFQSTKAIIYMKRIAVIAAKRSPNGKVPGEMNAVGETDLLAQVFSSVSAGYQNIITEAIAGSGFPIERDNLCRKATIMAGLPISIPASTISKTCASSDQALLTGCRTVWAGGQGAYLIGGCESIGQNSYTLHFLKRNVRAAWKGNLPEFDTAYDGFQENDMSIIAEILAKKHGITRDEQDCFTLNSWRRAQEAFTKGKFHNEILPVKEPYLANDEWLREERTASMLAEAKPMFIRGGTVTQYNAAAMCNCAAAMLIMNEAEAISLQLKPLGYILDGLSSAVPSERTGYAMEDCVGKLLKRNCLKIDDISLYEINESFAAQAISTIRQLGIPEEKVNVNGGNLALGYPIGATGMRMGITLLYEMRRRACRYGVSVMCAGGNMANAFLYQV